MVKIIQELNKSDFDKEIFHRDLKHELNNLKETIHILTDEKINSENLINSFNTSYMTRLGGLIEEILILRIAIYKKFNTDSLNKDTYHIKFNNAKLDYEEFQKACDQAIENTPKILSDIEKEDLRIIYRKASRLCHPDKLTLDKKQWGEELFKKLNEAYRKQDLLSAQEILSSLESRKDKAKKQVKQSMDNDFLKEKITQMQEKIASLKIEIKTLKESEIFHRIQSIGNMEAYFSKIENELRNELIHLKTQSNN